MSVSAESLQLRVLLQCPVIGRGSADGVLTIEAPLLAQEADFAVTVASNEADNDGFFLAALKAVHAAQLNTGKCLLQWSKQCKLIGRPMSAVLHPAAYIIMQ